MRPDALREVLARLGSGVWLGSGWGPQQAGIHVPSGEQVCDYLLRKCCAVQMGRWGSTGRFPLCGPILGSWLSFPVGR